VIILRNPEKVVLINFSMKEFLVVQVEFLKSQKIFGHLHRKASRYVEGKQGDQIGRIFACWSMVSCGHVFENYKKNNFGYFFARLKLHINFDRNWVALHFG
jgi:hypothetical protein